MEGREGNGGRNLGAGGCGINSVVGGIYNPLHLSRKRGHFLSRNAVEE